ncbi:MAG: BadF/BadG/BcrA/BcrD ATPase family protein [Gemmatimonadota bacterium]
MRDVADSAPGPRGPELGSSAFVAGVDGGGTGSRARILDLHGREVGSGEGPPALVDASDPAAVARAIETTVRTAAAEAGCPLPLRALWAGLAGAWGTGEGDEVEKALLSRALARSVAVGTDVEGAHRDAFGGGPGVLLVVGTGSIAWGRDPRGREIRVGGWGEPLGDEGSGYWMGLQGLRAIARAADGRSASTALSRVVLETLGLPEPRALIPWTANSSKGEIAALAPLVLEAAEAGDREAAEILAEGLMALLRHLEVVRSRWPDSKDLIPMALVGGLTVEGSLLRRRLAPLVTRVGGRLVSRAVIPARGAAQLALALARDG